MLLKFFMLSIFGPSALLARKFLYEHDERIIYFPRMCSSEYMKNLNSNIELYQNIQNNLTEAIFIYNKNFIKIYNGPKDDVSRNFVNAIKVIYEIMALEKNSYSEFYKIMSYLKKVFDPPKKYYKSLNTSVLFIGSIKYYDFEIKFRYENNSQLYSGLFKTLQENLDEIISFYDNNTAIIDRHYEDGLLEKSPLDFQYEIRNITKVIDEIVVKNEINQYAKYNTIISNVEKTFVAILEYFNGWKEGVDLINTIEQEIYNFEIMHKNVVKPKDNTSMTNGFEDYPHKRLRESWDNLQKTFSTIFNNDVIRAYKSISGIEIDQSMDMNFNLIMTAIKLSLSTVVQHFNELEKSIALINIIQQNIYNLEHLHKIESPPKVVTSRTSSSQYNLVEKLLKKIYNSSEKSPEYQIYRTFNPVLINRQNNYTKFYSIILDINDAFVAIAENYNGSKWGVHLIKTVEKVFSDFQHSMQNQYQSNVTTVTNDICDKDLLPEFKLYTKLLPALMNIQNFYIQNYNLTERAYQNHVLKKDPSNLKSSIKDATVEVDNIVSYNKNLTSNLVLARTSYEKTYNETKKAVDSVNFIGKETFNFEIIYEGRLRSFLISDKFREIESLYSNHRSEMEKACYNFLGRFASFFNPKFVVETAVFYRDIFMRMAINLADFQQNLFYIKTGLAAYAKERKERIDLIDGILKDFSCKSNYSY